MIIFCDGVFDLFHYGHINHFKKIKDLYPNSFLKVGVLSDELSTNYKRKPILNELKRKELVESCRYVDEVTINYPFIITEKYIIDNNIDLVVHAFSDEKDLNKQLKAFEIPIKLNKFLRIEYDKSISTSTIIKGMNQ